MCKKKIKIKHKIPTGSLWKIEVQLGSVQDVEKLPTFVRADTQTLVDVMAGEEGPRLRVHHCKLLPVSAQQNKRLLLRRENPRFQKWENLATRLYQNSTKTNLYEMQKHRTLPQVFILLQ